MEENDQELLDSTNETETTENKEEEVESTESEAEESVEELKKRLATAEAQKNHWKKKATEAKPEVKTSSDLSSKDVVALSRAEVHDDDIDEVIEYAKFKKISVAEALKSPVIKSTLETKAEQRKTADASNTGNARRSPAKISDEALQAKANAGQLPDDDDSIKRLITNKMSRK